MILSGIFHKLGQIFSRVFSKKTLDAVEGLAEKIQPYLAPAEKVVKMIDAAVPNWAAEEFIALADKYQLHVNEAVLDDKVQLHGLMQNAATKELLNLFPDAPEGLLRDAIGFCVHLIREEAAGGE